MLDFKECNITVVGFGARGADSVAILKSGAVSGVHYQVLDVPVDDSEFGESDLQRQSPPGFADIGLLILLIDDLSAAELRMAFELSSREVDAPYFVMAIGNSVADIDNFKAQSTEGRQLGAGTCVCLVASDANEDESGRMQHDERSRGDKLRSSIRGVAELLLRQDMVCFDLADLRSVLSMPGLVHFGFACAEGVGKEKQVAKLAIDSIPDGWLKVRSARGVVACILYEEGFGLASWSDIGDELEAYLSDDCTVVAAARAAGRSPRPR